MNRGKGNLVTILFLSIFFINILVVLIPIRDKGLFDSQKFTAELLKSFGLFIKEKKTYNAVPRLLGINITDSQSSGTFYPGIRAGIQSEYSIPGWADTRRNFRKNITINYQKVSSDLINFPTLIDLYDSDLHIDAQASGSDILFTDATGHLLDYEIEHYNRVYNSTHAHLVAWMKTNLSSTQDTIISMYYGYPAGSSQENPKGVWDNNYVGVWHLAEDPTGIIYDSSSSGNDGTSVGGMTSNNQIKGPIDGCLVFDGIDDYIDTGNDSSLDITGDITMQFWVKAENYVNDPDMLTKGSYTQAYSSFIYDANDDNSDGVFYFKLNNHNLISTSTLNTGTWYSIVGTREGTTMRIYINGLEDASDTYSTAIETIIDPLTIARSLDNLNGTMDEVRLSNIARSSDWIATEYNNQHDPASFYSVEQKESSSFYWDFPSFKYRKIITIDSNKVSGDLANFSVLIDISDSDLKNGKVQADGDDIIFTDEIGSKLDHEVEFFSQNSSHGHLIAWVRIPTLSSVDDTSLMMYYGDPSISKQENPEGVWDSYFQAVHHMEESPTSTLYDSTSNNEDLSPQGFMTSGDLVNAHIGQGIDFDDNNNDGFNSTSTIVITSFTFSAWVKFDSTDAWDAVVNVGNDTGSAFRWWGVNNGNHALDIMGTTYTFGSSLSTGVWYHLLVTYDSNGQTLRGFNQGSSEDIYTSINLGQITRGFQIGMWDGGGYFSDFFDGIIDEVQISNIARTPDWINTSYKNQFDPSSFYSLSDEEIYSDWWVDGSFRYRKTIVIDKDRVSSDLTNFPVLIDITDSNLKNGKVQPNAADILFVDQTGAKLDHEIEIFQQNESQGHLIAWVRIPSLSSISDTNITMYYGNNAVGTQENPEGVWIDYVGVWHLSEASGNADDSTQYDTAGIASNMNYQASGVIGYTFNWDEASRLLMVDLADGHLDFGTGNFTISFWINVDKDTGSSQYFMSKGAQFTGDIGYCLKTDNSPVSQYRVIAQSPSSVEASPSNFSFDEWNYIVMRLDRVTDLLYIYSNGTEDDTSDASALGDIDNFWPLQFPMDSTSYDMDGLLDEIRFSNLSRTPDWITTEYNNQKDPTSFYTVDDEQEYNGWWADASFKKRKDIVIDHTQFGSMVADQLEDFPLLIELYDSDLKTKVQSDGADILFFNNDGRRLDHEIELFDQTGNGTHSHLIAWVRIPSLRLNDNTILSMYYNNSEINQQENPEGVWSDNYVGVWH
ncbi:MAG: DUF2341 domain-containing protein, partial [Promethearchaeota archaeon]